MQFCIYGAGAGGGHFAVRLAQTGHDVCLIARGQSNKFAFHAGLLFGGVGLS